MSVNVIMPDSAEAAAAVLAGASREERSVYPAGAGERARAPALSGARIVLAADRLSEVHSYEPGDLTATVGAGMRLDALDAALGRHDQWWPVDPPRRASATVGGVVAAAAAGPLRAGYGTPRRHVLGVELVTGDGRVLEFGGRVVKNVAGYDVTKLVIGSRGTLGFITRVHLRLHPRPRRDTTFVVAAHEPEPLLETVAVVRNARLRPAALELISPELAVWEVSGDWALAVRAHGPEDAVADFDRRLRECAVASEVIVLDPAAAGGLWERLARSESEAAVCARFAAQPAALARTLERARGIAAPLAAHSGEGIVRLLPSPSEFAAVAIPRWAEVFTAARAELAAARGSLVLTGGPPELYERIDPFGNAGPTSGLMRAIKREFDPAGIMAPGTWDL